MRVLVTGAAGFLGSHLCQEFLEQGDAVTAFHRLGSGLAALSGMNVAHALGDVTDPDSVARAVSGHDLVVHAAASLSYWRGVAHAQTAVNVGGTRTVAAACLKFGVSRLVFVSSVAAVGIPGDGAPPADESFVFNLERAGLNYPLSKWLAEKEVLAAVEAGLDAVIVNPSSIFGPFGSSYRGRQLVDQVRDRRLVLHFSGGFNAVHVNDAVRGLVSASRNGKRGERYILGGENIRYADAVRSIAARMQVRRVLVPIPRLVTGTAALVLEPLSRITGKRPRLTFDTHATSSRMQFYESGKAIRELGYSPRPYAAIVDDTLEWMSRRNAA